MERGLWSALDGAKGREGLLGSDGGVGVEEGGGGTGQGSGLKSVGLLQREEVCIGGQHRHRVRLNSKIKKEPQNVDILRQVVS